MSKIRRFDKEFSAVRNVDIKGCRIKKTHSHRRIHLFSYQYSIQMASHSSHTSFQFVVTSKPLKVELSKVAVAFQATLLC